MELKYRKETFELSDDHPLALCLLQLARTYALLKKAELPATGKQDLELIWGQLTGNQQKFLREIAKKPKGIGHEELRESLGLDNLMFRGSVIGLSRIFARHQFPKPYSSDGYDERRRVFSMDPNLAAKIVKLPLTKKSKDAGD